MEDNTVATNGKVIANKLSKFFCSLGKTLSNKITAPVRRILELPSSNPKTGFIKPADKLEALRIINDLKQKTRGVDGIGARTTKHFQYLSQINILFILYYVLKQKGAGTHRGGL